MLLFVSIQCHVLYGSDVAGELKDILDDDDLELVLSAKHRPNCLIQLMTELLKVVQLEDNERSLLVSEEHHISDCAFWNPPVKVMYRLCYRLKLAICSSLNSYLGFCFRLAWQLTRLWNAGCQHLPVQWWHQYMWTSHSNTNSTFIHAADFPLFGTVALDLAGGTLGWLSLDGCPCYLHQCSFIILHWGGEFHCEGFVVCFRNWFCLGFTYAMCLWALPTP